MAGITYYYINPSEPYKVQATDFLDEFIFLLYDGKADFIMDGQRIELKLPKKYFDTIRKNISQYDQVVPLYDIKSNRIYLVSGKNVYARIYFDEYRIIDKNFVEDLKKLSNKTKFDKENLRFMSYYDMEILQNTYWRLFYKSFVLDSYITSCRRPSFGSGMEHISPYYGINELYYLVYDWNLTDKVNLDEEELEKYCKIISRHDIPAKTLLDHQMYIYDSKAIGLVKHYSLFGSYYMNLYLRKNQCCLPGKRSYEDVIRNLYLENQIKIMINLIINSPEFTESHTVYRFVEKDDYIKNLKIGDIYQDASFMSTTRNPFYYKENYEFGYILIKIKLPKGIKGIGLCIEAYSNFPNEEEIILPPTSKYRLDKLFDSKEITHIEGIYDLKVKKKYEFTWIGNDYLDNRKKEIIIDMPGAYIPDVPLINFMDLLVKDDIKYLSISDRLNYFRQNYTNNNNQFESIIANNKYTFNLEAYDSTTIYKPFFYFDVSDGIMITTSNPKYGNINIMMELGQEIHINYYFRYSVTDLSIAVDLNRPEWIEWFALLAYILGSQKIIFHSNYVLQYNKNDTIEQKQMQTRYTFSQNIYIYLKYKKKMFEFAFITPKFDYAQLDMLFVIPTEDIVKPTDRDELFLIYQNSGKGTVADFYLYIIENFPKLIKIMEEKMGTLYEPEKNPFNNIYYTLDAWLYLYDKNLIKQIPSEKEFVIRKGSFKKLVGTKKIPKFKNRLRTYLNLEA